MTDAEYKSQQAEAKSKIKVLQSTKDRTPAQNKELKRLQVFRTSLSPSKQKQVKKNIGTAKDIALTGLTAIPGLGALGLGARAIMKGIQAGKTVFKVGNKTFKSKDAAVAAAKKIKAPLPPKAKGNLSKEARGREHITRLAEQKKKTPGVRAATTRGITKTAAQKEALKTSAKRSGAGAAGLGAISATAAAVSPSKAEKKIPLIKAPSGPFKVRPKGWKKSASKVVKEKKPKVIKKVAKKKFEGEPRTIAQAKKMGKKYFINKAGKKLAAVTKEDLAKFRKKTGNPKATLTQLLNARRKLVSPTEWKRKSVRKTGGIVKKAGGGRMNTDELRTAEMRSAGKDLHQPQSKIKKRIKKETRYASLGGKVGGQDYRDREDESISNRLGKGKATKKNPKKAAKERNLSYGKWGKGTGKGKINRKSSGASFVASLYD